VSPLREEDLSSRKQKKKKVENFNEKKTLLVRLLFDKYIYREWKEEKCGKFKHKLRKIGDEK
jgi:vacuolar-type H+-ATPase subunit I/STV1